MRTRQIKFHARVLALVFLAASALAGMSASDQSTLASAPVISNRKPRLDTAGNIVDAHDGCLQKFGDRYYLYGTAYGNRDATGRGICKMDVGNNLTGRLDL